MPKLDRRAAAARTHGRSDSGDSGVAPGTTQEGGDRPAASPSRPARGPRPPVAPREPALPPGFITTAPSADPPPTSWAGRYGQIILQGGIAAIPFALYTYQGQLGLSAAEVWFVSTVLAEQWDATLPHPSLQVLELQSGASLSRLKRLRTELKNQHYLEVQARYDARTAAQQPSSYDFSGLFQQIEWLLHAEPPAPNAIAAPDTPPPTDSALAADTSFVARYGRVIAKAGIAAIPRALFRYQQQLALSPTQVWFICYILAHRWSSDFPYPSLKKMAERTGYSQEHVHTTKDELVQLGYLRVINRYGPQGSQLNNAYDFSGLLTTVAGLLQPPVEAAPTEASPVPPSRLRRGRSGPDNRPAPPTAVPDPVVAAPPVRIPPLPRSLGSERSSLIGSSCTDSSFSQVGGPPGSQGADLPPSQASDPPAGELPTLLSGRRPPPSQIAGPLSLSGERPPLSQVYDPLSLSGERPPPATYRTPGASRLRPVESAAPDSPWLRRMTEDFTRELEGPLQRDPAASRRQIAGNMTQTLLLWRASGCAEDQFAALLQEARQRTQQAKGHQPQPGLLRPMAYFYTVVSALLAADPDPVDPPPAPPPVRLVRAWEVPTEVGEPPAPIRPGAANSAAPGAAPPAPPPYSPYIAALILDYARTMGVGPQGPAGVTSILQRWQASGLPETRFVAVLQAAQAQVQRRTSGGGPVVQALPQLLRALEQLLAEAGDGGERAAAPGADSG